MSLTFFVAVIALAPCHKPLGLLIIICVDVKEFRQICASTGHCYLCPFFFVYGNAIFERVVLFIDAVIE